MPADNKNKVTVVTLNKNKQQGKKTVLLSCYDFPSAQIADEAGIDCLLVGDSLGMTTAGLETTIPVTMDQMIMHAQYVARGSKNCFLIGDHSFGSYQRSDQHAIENAERFIIAGMDAVKVEGCQVERVKAINKAGILVMSHIGLTPHTRARFGGYKVQGKTANDAEKLINQAKQLQDAGCFALLLEAVPNEVGGKVREALSIPVYGIGAGNQLDGQLVILHDLIGLFRAFKSKFVKRYAELGVEMFNALNEYATEVRAGTFPTEEQFYEMKDEELDKLLGDDKWKYAEHIE